ncbi:PH domain-containing protein [Actinopolymorpha alba]|uniref:PH domain-containing protein n=1 Tax=Actinopolymorpha alba TaxID=533267 RepID=UPI000365DFBB|nr:PH domain-containing protein [Actinopolymorpha alba]
MTPDLPADPTTSDPTTSDAVTADAVTAEPAPAAATHAEQWRRLSPRMLAVHPVQELVRALPALVGLLIAGSSSGHGSAWSLVGLGLVILFGTLRWFTTTFRITPEQVQVRRGLLRRRVLTVPRDRIRTVDITANAMHRVVGLARVVIGTGHSSRQGDDGLKLDALVAADAARLREELLHRPTEPQPVCADADSAASTGQLATTSAATTAGRAEPGDPETRLATLDPRWIRYGPFTLSGLLTIGVLLGFGWRAVSEAGIDPAQVGPVHDAITQLGRAGWLVATIEVLAGLVVVSAVASTLAYVLAFWNFRLTRHAGGTLHVTRGLITTRATSIEERRLRGVEFSEPLQLRAVGGARCIAIATGLRVGRGAERGGSLLLPPAPRSEAVRVAGEVIHDVRPITCQLVAHGPRARRRRYTRAVGMAALLVVVFVALRRFAGFPDWAWEASLALLPAAAFLAFDRTRSLGHALVDGRLVCRWGSLVRRRSVLSCDGIIGWNIRQSYFQRRAGLATLTATTAAGHQHYAIQDVDLAEGLLVADEAVPGLLRAFLAAPDGEPAPAR